MDIFTSLYFLCIHISCYRNENNQIFSRKGKHFLCDTIGKHFDEEECLTINDSNDIIASLSNKYSEMVLDTLYFYSRPINPFTRWFDRQNWNSGLETGIKLRLSKSLSTADRFAHPFCRFIFQRPLEHWGTVFRIRHRTFYWLLSSYKMLYSFNASAFIAVGCSEHAFDQSTYFILFVIFYSP